MFSIGDSRRPSTWSNVPYFFTRELEHQGCQVARIDIGPPRSVQLLFDVPWKAWCRLTGVRTKYTFQRSMVNRRATQARISRALRQHPEGHCIFMTFSFSTREKARPYTLFCDQSFAQHIAYFDERSPDHLEYPTVLEERRNMEEAGIIVALFPEVAEDLRYAYGEKVKYFGNVVNIELPAGGTEAALNVKRATNEIVFIGSRKYKAGLERLVEAVDFLNEGLFAGLVVNVIGMKRKDMPTAPANMVFHGYLDKGKPTELRRYTDILSRARLFVNRIRNGPRSPHRAKPCSCIRPWCSFSTLSSSAPSGMLITWASPCSPRYHSILPNVLPEYCGMMPPGRPRPSRPTTPPRA
ncbi:MAG: hypothetical protein IPN44_00080 [Flavobacteriales bacterium]|nr:hypothetical protein [Flavobacteriales bacterium]